MENADDSGPAIRRRGTPTGRGPVGNGWRLVYRVVLICLAVYGGLCFLAWWFHPRLLYHPEASPGRMPAELLRRGGEELWLTAPDGTRLHGWRIPAAGPDGIGGVLLAFHGNAGNLSTAAVRLAVYSDLGCDVYMVDYPGYGGSGGTPDEAGLYGSALALWEHVTLEKGHGPGEVAILGYSLGGAVAAWLAERNPAARGLILESSFTSLADVASTLFPFLPCRALVGDAYDSLSRLDSIRPPLLVVHGEGDELVPYAHGQELYRRYRGEKAFLRIGNDHNVGFLANGDSYEQGLRNFLGQDGPAKVERPDA